LGRTGYFGDQTVHLGHAGGNGCQGRAGVVHQLDALGDLGRGGRDQRFDLLGRRRRPLGQGPDFLGNDGKAATGIPGPCRLDPGVQRQEIGLECDLVNNADDLADLVGALLEVLSG